MSETFSMALDKWERICAERDALYAALRDVLALHRGSEFMFHEEQSTLRGARALLAEVKPLGER